MSITKQELEKIFQRSGADVMIALDREGKESEVLFGVHDKTKEQIIFPIMTEKYKWGREDQIKGAKEFRDRIEYIYHPEEDDQHPMLPIWRLDDVVRLETTRKLPFGKRVLETGCSSGTVTIEIAKLDGVEEVIGVDLRDDAIEIANDLVKKLMKKKELSQEAADKASFIVSAMEDLEYPDESFDSVCAFEVLEHLTPTDFENAVPQLVRLMKPSGNVLISLPNRYPDKFYVNEGRARWNAPDHKNFFSKISLEYYLKRYFNDLTFYQVDSRSWDKGVYLVCECKDKK